MSVYLFKPPTWRRVVEFEKGSGLLPAITVSTVVYRQDGVWHNILECGVNNPIVTDCDVDADSNLRLFFVKPMVVPGSLYDELSALVKGDPSWADATLTQL